MVFRLGLGQDFFGKSREDFRSENNPKNKQFITFSNILNNTIISKNNFGNVGLRVYSMPTNPGTPRTSVVMKMWKSESDWISWNSRIFDILDVRGSVSVVLCESS